MLQSYLASSSRIFNRSTFWILSGVCERQDWHEAETSELAERSKQNSKTWEGHIPSDMLRISFGLSDAAVVWCLAIRCKALQQQQNAYDEPRRNIMLKTPSRL